MSPARAAAADRAIDMRANIRDEAVMRRKARRGRMGSSFRLRSHPALPDDRPNSPPSHKCAAQALEGCSLLFIPSPVIDNPDWTVRCARLHFRRMTKTRSRRHVVVVDNTSLARAIGARIRRARQQAGLSQRALAADRFSPSYISALETGSVKPSMAALSYLAERLDCSINDLVDDARSVGPRTGQRLEADLRLASGDWERAAQLFRDLLASVSQEAERGELLRGLSEALVRQDRAREAIDPASRAVELFERLGRASDAAESRYWLAAAHYRAENVGEAKAIYRALLERVHADEPPTADFRGRLLVAAANAEIWSGDRHLAANYLEEARGLADGMGDKQRAAFLLSLALSYRDSGDLEGAIRAGQRSLALYASLDARREQVTLENGLALAYLGLGVIDKAGTHAARARELANELGASELEAHIADTMAQIALARRDWPRAIALAGTALSLAEAGGNRHAEVDALLTRGRAHSGAGDGAAEIADYERAVSVARTAEPMRQLRAALGALADALVSSGRHAEAVAVFQEIVNIDS